jgi:glycerophosphoryl diester phosphodiesterase
VLNEFPRVPINVEIKGRTKKEAVSEYLVNARVLARELRTSKHPDLIVVSFKQQAVDLFHSLGDQTLAITTAANVQKAHQTATRGRRG